MMTIALDAAGGDTFPVPQIEGAKQALAEVPELRIILVGPEDVIQNELQNTEYDPSRLLVQNAPEIVDMHESASVALKTKPNSSIMIGTGLHKKGHADAFVSAGNTGALLAASMFILGKLEGVIRPTIAAPYPTVKGYRLLVDAGANLAVKRPEIYKQFGQMAAVFCEYVMGVENPKIGLINVGEEKEKGSDELKQAYELLSELDNFVGNIEGKDIFNCKSDIFLTDGLLGNVLLKFGESIPDALSVLVKDQIKKQGLTPEQTQLIFSTLRSALAPFYADDVGGVPFLGVNGTTLVGHGSTSATAIKNLVLGATKCLRHSINDKMLNLIQ